MTLVLFVAILAFMALGVPIVAAMGVASFGAFLTHALPNYLVTQTMFYGINSFTLLAIPLFVFAGEILHRSGASATLIRFVLRLVGWLPGGLGITVVIATMIFSGLSGSVNADAAAIGAVTIEPMVSAGYSAEWASAIVAAAAGTGILIPPSITMIALGTIANLSIQGLFLAAMLPALIVGTSKILVIYGRARWFEAKRQEQAVAGGGLGRAFVSALPTLLAPVVILGGILTGVFTATEAAAVAVLYAFLLALAYRKLRAIDWRAALVATGRLTGVVMTLVGVASTVAYILAREQVSDAVASWAAGFASDRLAFIAVLTLLFWVMGALMDGLPALIILIPLFLPLARQAGMLPLHFAIFSLAVVGISLVTPPLGTACFVVTGISRTSINRMFMPMLPFILILFGTILLLAFVPALSLWMPRLAHIPA